MLRVSFYFLLLLVLSHSIIAQDYSREPLKLIGGEGNFFIQPRWSPDGAQIAFTSSNYQGLWIMQANESGVQQLTDESAAGFGFEWSADSKAIITRVARFEKGRRLNALKLFNCETNQSRLITEYRLRMPGLPHWADNDRRIFIFTNGKLEVYPSGKNPETLLKPAVEQNIYFLKGEQPAQGNLSTQKYRLYEALKDWQCLNLTVSPDRTKIAFEVLGGDLYVMNVDGSGLINLGEGHRPQWAPDSQHLVYMITRDDGHQYLAADICSIKIDGSEKRVFQLTPDRLEMNPCWSPDGRKIVFDIFDEGAIYLLELFD